MSSTWFSSFLECSYSPNAWLFFILNLNVTSSKWSYLTFFSKSPPLLRASAHPRGVFGQIGKKMSFLKTVYLHCEKMILIHQFTWKRHFTAICWITVIIKLHICGCSAPKSCPVLFDPADCSAPGFHVLRYLPEFVQIHVHWVGDAIYPSHPLPPPSFAFNISQHHVFFQWVGSLHHVAKVLELQHQSLQWTPRTDLL